MDIYSVSEINAYIKTRMDGDDRLSRLMVSGELSNFKSHSSGHCYFTLKDKNAALRSVMFKSRAQRLTFRPADGMKVVAGGHITVYERDGQYQMYVDTLLLAGAGELYLAYESLKKRLREEGLFDEEHKQSLPFFPRSVGVVTSATGAVLRDIFKVAKRRDPTVSICLYPVQVQGEGAAEQIAAGIDFFNRRYPVDVLIVGRGGGSLEDLWAFNEEIVVRGVFRSKIPVISAVGHQTDFTLCDLASDARAATPSHAAEMAVPDAAALQRQVDGLAERLHLATSRLLEVKRSRLALCAGKRYFREASLFLTDKRQFVDSLQERFDRVKNDILHLKKETASTLEAKLRLLNPLSVVARGFCIVKNAAGERVKNVCETAAGEKIEITLSGGRLRSTIDEVVKDGR